MLQKPWLYKYRGMIGLSIGTTCGQKALFVLLWQLSEVKIVRDMTAYSSTSMPCLYKVRRFRVHSCPRNIIVQLCYQCIKRFRTHQCLVVTCIKLKLSFCSCHEYVHSRLASRLFSEKKYHLLCAVPVFTVEDTLPDDQNIKTLNEPRPLSKGVARSMFCQLKSH